MLIVGVALVALFLFRLLFGLSSEFFFEDETQIYLMGLRYYATGAWPYFGADVVWTRSEIPGALQALLGALGQWVFVSRTAFLISFVGAIALVYGVKMLKELVYPLCTLVLMIAPPNFVFENLTLRLQLLASRLGADALEALGYSVLREGNILEMVGIKLSVEEACSGIRSLLSLSFLALVYGYFFEKKIWLRVVLFVATVPIAMLANACRVTVTGILADYNPEYAHGLMHSASGMVIFMVALAFLGVFHQLMNVGYRALQSKR